MTREDFKIYEGVFNQKTIMNLSKLQKDYFGDLYGCIATGKEADVYYAKSRNPLHEFVAVKIYRFETSSFDNMMEYIRGDPRYESVGKSKRDIIYAWAQKEYSNLIKAHSIGVRVPKPFAFRENVLVMEYIGSKKGPARIAKNSPPQNPEEWYGKIIKYIKDLYKKEKLIHSDLSEYNILNYKEKPVLIDWGQSVIFRHPQAIKFLKRDIKNINKWFSSMGVDVIGEDVFFDEVVRE